MGTGVHVRGAPELSDVDKQHLRDFEFALKLLRTRATSVACGYHTGVYVHGRPGSSKTWSVTKELERLDVPWAYRNGRMSPFGLFDFLREHRDATVVLDDIPSLLQHRQALQIFVAALGGAPGRLRPVTYTIKGTEGRQTFDFSGGIIAIANEPLRRGPLADAVQSRVVLLEHEPSDAMLSAFSWLVTTSLVQEGVLARADFRGGEEGWLIKRQWWDQQFLRVATVPLRLIFQRLRVGKLPKVKSAG